MELIMFAIAAACGIAAFLTATCVSAWVTLALAAGTVIFFALGFICCVVG